MAMQTKVLIYDKLSLQTVTSFVCHHPRDKRYRYYLQSESVSREAVADAVVPPVLSMFAGNHYTTARVCLAHVNQLFEARRQSRREQPTMYSKLAANFVTCTYYI